MTSQEDRSIGEFESNVLKLLRNDPSEAAKEFDELGGVISALVISGADLEVIKTACRLSQSALSQVGENGWLPLHHACLHSLTASDVLRFLTEVYPDALTVPDEDGCLPIHLALMDRGATLGTIKAMVEPKPGTLIMENEDGLSPLDLALLHNNSRPNLLEYMFSRVPQELTTFILHPQIILTLDSAKILSKILPQLTKFGCKFSEHGTSEGYRYLLECLETNQSITYFILRLPTDEFLSDDDSIALESLIANNTIIETFSFLDSHKRRNDIYDDKSFLALQKGFLRRGNRPVKELKLKSLSLSDCSKFRNFLNNAAASKVEMHNLGFAGSYGVKGAFMDNCQVQDLTISFSNNFSAGWCLSALSDLSSMRSLVKLCFHAPGGLDKNKLTEAITEIILNGHLLCLEIINAHDKLDALHVGEALARNRRLQIFKNRLIDNKELERHEAYVAKVLQRHNTTLKWVDLGVSPCIRLREMTNYYTRLNRFGRQQARDPETTLADFVELLSCTPKIGVDDMWLATDAPSWLGMETLRPRNKHNIQFGLLLESPGLWS